MDLAYATFIVLLRGINVGGHRSVKMARLRELLGAEGFEGVATYIQSGNVALRGVGSEEEVEGRVRGLFERHLDFVPQVMVVGAERLEAIVTACPFADEAAAEPKLVHAWFLSQAVGEAGRARLEALSATLATQGHVADPWELGEKVVYLHTPRGLSKSKLAERLERTVGVASTARNWRTVLKLRDMARALEA